MVAPCDHLNTLPYASQFSDARLFFAHVNQLCDDRLNPRHNGGFKREPTRFLSVHYVQYYSDRAQRKPILLPASYGVPLKRYAERA